MEFIAAHFLDTQIANAQKYADFICFLEIVNSAEIIGVLKNFNIKTN